MKKIRIGRVKVGLLGLEEVFKALRDSGVEDETLKVELIRKIKAYNHIPPGLEEKYAAVLVDSYHRWLTDPKD